MCIDAYNPQNRLYRDCIKVSYLVLAGVINLNGSTTSFAC